MSKIVLFALVVDVPALDDLGEEGPHRAALAIEKTGLVSGFLRKQANKSQLGNVTRLQADESIGKSSPNRDCEPHRAEQRPGDELASGV